MLFFSRSFDIASDITATSEDNKASSGSKIVFACQASNKAFSLEKKKGNHMLPIMLMLPRIREPSILVDTKLCISEDSVSQK